MSLVLPDPHDEFALEMDDGAAIRFRRHGDPDARVRLYITNGNGFAVDGYLPFWGPLGEDFDLTVFDMRNHGRNGRSNPDHHHYDQLSRDIGRIREGVGARLGDKPSVGIFHSMSARSAMKHAVENGWVWDALVLFDPPNVPPEGHRLYEAMCIFEYRLEEWAKNRPERFADPSELAAHWAGTRAHAGWAHAHDLMARAVTHRDPETGEYVLTCPPELEARIYRAAVSMDLWPRAEEFGGPVKLIGADPEMRGGPPTGRANQALAEENGYIYEFIPGAGHMLQIEKPAECRRAVLSFLEEFGLA